ncbi:prohibitin family protein [Phaeodactylibacter luteus]|uniref:Prohibitin family protein n=1 Tax=Phaeodactylibacter luteus TaxID=1564516 RepID=A0A5C6S220_9BACT|nr:prohibitin family protein [Phaeodactylibacter luteus]TXB67662.1 prohibitin family protein [Phaeodactylibacter luteus]
MSQSKLITYGIIVFIGLIAILTFSNATFLTIESGERGVLFKRFGGGLDKENIYDPGFHVIAPWNVMYVYDIREKQLDEDMTVLSSNGLNIKVEVTVRVNPRYDNIGDLHEKFGPQYIESLVRPEVRSSVREIIGQFSPEELYSTKRNEVQIMIQEDLNENLGENYVDLRATLIRNIELPDKVRAAIESKIEAEQQALKYEYILQQERKEAERKIIEAEAKSESNRILSASLTDKILQDKGIEATLQLANSPNSKVIVVGGGDKGGLPLILGNN